MSTQKSWQLGTPGSWLYRMFDAVREQLNRRLVFRLARALNGDANRVLEAGSGTACASEIFSKRPEVHFSLAADLDMQALLIARRRDPGLPLVAADLRALPFMPGAFHLVWNSSTLEHLPRMNPALREMRRCAAENGLVFVGVPFLFGPLGFQRLINGSSIGQWIGSVYSQSELIEQLRQSGLEPQKSFPYFLRFFIGCLAKPSIHEEHV